MNNVIYIETGKQLTLEQYVPIAAETMLLIADAAEAIHKRVEPFSATDLSVLLNRITSYMSGDFEIQRTPSRYCLVTYKPYALTEAELDDEYIVSYFADTQDRGQNFLWINEKVFKAFIDRELYGLAFMLYFHLGCLMARDAAFAVSHNISFERILETCDVFPEDYCVKYPTTLMRALADLQDVGLIKWNTKSRTFQLLHITPYDPKQQV